MNEVAFSLTFGPLVLRDSILLSMLLTALLTIVGSIAVRSGSQSALHTAAEAAMEMVEGAVGEMISKETVHLVFPFIATLWLYVLCANLVGLIPGLSSPTRDLSITSALAAIVFCAVHVYGIRVVGFKRYFSHYLQPSPLLLPFHLISEVTRTLALAIRLFGNMLSLEMAALLILLVAGFLVPVPLLLLHVVEALVQAYIFGILALIYIATGLERVPDET